MGSLLQELRKRRKVPLSFNAFMESLELILEKHWEDFSPKTVERAKWIILDTAMAAWDGMQSEELATYLTNVGTTTKDQLHPIPIVGTAYYTSGHDSLLLHGASIVSNELDEGNQFAKGHPAAHIFAPAYLVAVEQGATGKEFIHAFILAYEISTRFAYACNMNDAMHPHGTWGTIGGAVAAGILQKKEKKEIIEMILIAASLPLATSFEAAMTGQTVRNVYTGISAQIAYQVLSMQKSGFTSSLSVVEHIWGSIISNKVNEHIFMKDIWSPPLIDKSFFKYYPTCRFTHSTIDALYGLLKETGVDTTKITSVKVETYQLAARLKNKTPKNKLSAKFAIPYIVANILLEKNLYTIFSQEALKDEEVLTLASKIEVVENQEMTKLLPEERAAKVIIHTVGGEVLQKEVKDASGSFKEPLSVSILKEKYQNMIKVEQVTHRLIDSTLTLESELDIRSWIQLLQRKEGEIYEASIH